MKHYKRNDFLKKEWGCKISSLISIDMNEMPTSISEYQYRSLVAIEKENNVVFDDFVYLPIENLNESLEEIKTLVVGKFTFISYDNNRAWFGLTDEKDVATLALKFASTN